MSKEVPQDFGHCDKMFLTFSGSFSCDQILCIPEKFLGRLGVRTVVLKQSKLHTIITQVNKKNNWRYFSHSSHQIIGIFPQEK